MISPQISPVKFGNSCARIQKSTQDLDAQLRGMGPGGQDAANALQEVRERWAHMSPAKRNGIKGLASALLVTVALRRHNPAVLRIAAGLGAALLLLSMGVSGKDIRESVKRASTPMKLPHVEAKNPLERMQKQLESLSQRKAELLDKLPHMAKDDMRTAATEIFQIEMSEAELLEQLEAHSLGKPEPKGRHRIVDDEPRKPPKKLL